MQNVLVLLASVDHVFDRNVLVKTKYTKRTKGNK